MVWEGLNGVTRGLDVSSGRATGTAAIQGVAVGGGYDSACAAMLIWAKNCHPALLSRLITRLAKI